METFPSLLANLFEFATAVLGNTWTLWGALSTATPLIAEFVAAFMSDEARAKVRKRLPWTSARRRTVFVALGALGFTIAVFQAFDEVNGKLRDAQLELARAKAELAQAKSGGTLGHQSGEASRRLAYVNGQLGRFATRALDLWTADVTRDQFPRWAQLQEAFVAEASKWVEDNLGADAKDKLLAAAPFPNLSGARLVDPSQRERLVLLDSIARNIAELMQDVSMNSAKPNPAGFPSPPSPPSPATGNRP